MDRRVLLLSSAALILGLSSGFAALSGVTAAPLEATIVLSIEETGAPHLDPIRATLLSVVASLVYDRLVAMSNQHTFHPHLAKSWEESEDGLTWTFRLKEGVRFHDGEPFNAETIVWWISKFDNGPNQHVGSAIKRVVVVDQHSVRFEMKRPDPNLLYNLASVFMGIPSPKAYEAAGENYGVTVAVGTGPFKLESFVVGQETVLVANGEYSWGSELSRHKDAPALKRLTFREIQDASTAFLELNTGGVDMLLGVPTEFVPQLTANNQIEVRNLPASGISYLEFNVGSAPFSDRLMRQAVALAVDQEPIMRAVFSGSGVPAHQFLISSLEESKVRPDLLIRKDTGKAKKLLDDMGWVVGQNGIRAKAGVPLKVQLWASSETAFKRIAEIIQAQLKEVGFEVAVTLFDSASLSDALGRGEHQLVVNNYDWDNADILSWFFSEKNIPRPNTSFWKDPVSEQLCSDAENGARTSQERVAKFKKYHENLLENFAFVPLHEYEKTIAFNKNSLAIPPVIPEVGLGSVTLLDTNR